MLRDWLPHTAFILASVLPIASAHSGNETVLYSFCSRADCADGANPDASLIEIGGTLYGTTSAGGTYGGGSVFALDPVTGVETVLHSFGNAGDGSAPRASLIDVNGTLYGTTEQGGTYHHGTVFAFDAMTGVEMVLYSFCSKSGCADGAAPDGSLLFLKGTLYGTTNSGGPPPRDSGTVFGFDLNTGRVRVLHAFSGGKSLDAFSGAGGDGGYPAAGLINIRRALYGTTYTGGNKTPCYAGVGCGTVFSLDLGTGAETVRYVFNNNGRDGFNPLASLIQINGKLYGTTSYGGTGAEGTVFSLDRRTGAETVVYSFCSRCSAGATPVANLLDLNGTLYGTTSRGGTASATCNSVVCGAVFSINIATGNETTVHGFCTDAECADGEAPVAGLIDINGTLYGTTLLGGTGTGASCKSRYGCGTVFAVTP